MTNTFKSYILSNVDYFINSSTEDIQWQVMTHLQSH